MSPYTVSFDAYTVKNLRSRVYTVNFGKFCDLHGEIFRATVSLRQGCLVVSTLRSLTTFTEYRMFEECQVKNIAQPLELCSIAPLPRGVFFFTVCYYSLLPTLPYGLYLSIKKTRTKRVRRLRGMEAWLLRVNFHCLLVPHSPPEVCSFKFP